MKQLKLLLISVLLFGACAEAPDRNCTDFRTGSFSFSQKIDGAEQTTLFSRTTNLQIEEFNGKTDSATVRWINDCEYILTTINPKSAQEKRPVHIKILTTTDSSYTFEFNIVGESEKLRGTAIKTN
ncbi:DNA topoisomerase IV [Muricauda sp. DJ-13]|uniref:DNA topoisomerase IV n=2 Tax=Croceivirga thetidis TaxID=2721623 RepID=A0ABX1GQN3_9FLAO|nr:DNA topoisomerase IV [Croceivirga thetidis]